MGFRREFQEHQKHASMPGVNDLGRRNREVGLNQAVRVYPEAPSTETLDDGWVGFFFDENNLLVVRGYKNGKLSEVVGTEVV